MLGLFTAAVTHAAAPEVKDLIGQYLAAEQKPLLLRLRMAVRQADGRDDVTQLVVKRRRDADLVRVVYQVYWPAAREGDALYFEGPAGSGPTGFVLKRGSEPRPLADALRERYLDSDLDVEDLLTNFWQWPTHDWVGQGRVDRDACWILESRPARPMATGCAAVRSWISESKLIPLQTEFLDSEGRVLKTALVQKTTRFEGQWAPVLTQVRRAGGSTTTTIEIVRADRDRALPLEEFSLEALQRPRAAP